MDNLIWYIIMIPCSALFSGIGVYAWNRKKTDVVLVRNERQ